MTRMFEAAIALIWTVFFVRVGWAWGAWQAGHDLVERQAATDRLHALDIEDKRREGRIASERVRREVR